MNENENVMKKGQARFSLLGKAYVTDATYTLNTTSESGYTYNKLSLGVDCGNGNIIYTSMMGGYNPKKNYPIYVHGKKEDGKDDFKAGFQIDWEDRKDTSILKDVGDACFIKVSLERDKDGKPVTEKFISEYDAIEYVYEHLNDGDVIRVNGNLEYSTYNDEVRMNKAITGIFINSSETDPETFKANFTQAFLLDQNSFDKKIDKEKNTYTVYGYVVDYISKYNGMPIKKNAAFPVKFEIDASRYTDKQLGVILKNYFVGEKNWYSELVVEGDLVEGVVVSSSTVEDLPQEMQELVNMGLLSTEEAISKMTIKGNKEKRMIFNRPLIVVSKDDETGGKTKVYYEPKRYKHDEVIMYTDIIGANDSENEESEGDSSSDIDFLFPNAN